MSARSVERILLPAATGVALLLAWHYAVVWTGTKVFPAPRAVLAGMQELARRGLLMHYTLDSLYRVGVGYSLAVVVGIPSGLLLGWYPLLGRAFGPVLQVLRPISPLAWIPIAIVLFKIGDAAAIFLIFLSSYLSITASALSAVRSVPAIYVRAAKNFGLSPVALFAKVVFPASIPELLVGLRLALGIAWLVVVAAEMIAVDSGLGYLVVDARNAGKRYDLVVGAMVLIGAVGLALDVLFRQLQRLPALRWASAEGAR